jgi:uncharacterized lipoprotein
MKTTLITLATALALGLAGCDRNSTPDAKQPTNPSAPASSAPTTAPGSSSAGSSTAPSAPTSNTPTTPANIGGASSQAEKQPPVQGREDVRQPEQRRDFEHKGDGAGPKPGG